MAYASFSTSLYTLPSLLIFTNLFMNFKSRMHILLLFFFTFYIYYFTVPGIQIIRKIRN